MTDAQIEAAAAEFRHSEIVAGRAITPWDKLTYEEKEIYRISIKAAIAAAAEVMIN